MGIKVQINAKGKEVYKMTAKGYVVLRYSGPHQPEGAYEAWEAKLWEITGETSAQMVEMGCMKWVVMNDSYDNIPRRMAILEFATEEQARAFYNSELGAENARRWVAAGTLDYSWSVYRLTFES